MSQSSGTSTKTHKKHPRTIFVVLAGLVCMGVSALVTRFIHGAKHNFNPPQSALHVGFRETAAHRPAPAPVPVARHEGMPETVDLWVHINEKGKVLDVKGIDEPNGWGTQVRPAAESMHYVPFTQNGRPVEVYAQETLWLITAPSKPSRIVSFPAVIDQDKILIQLQRSGCFGSCPSYSVSIRGDGEVNYQGKSSVSIPGAHSAHVDPARVSALMERFRAANFLALKDTYRAGVTDNPTYCLSLTLNGKTKAVLDYVGEWVGMPGEVSELEQAVDQVADSARWVTSSSGTLDAMHQANIAFDSEQATGILHVAVSAGDVGTVRSLLAAGTPIESPDRIAPGVVGLFAGRSSSSLPELVVSSRNEASRLKMMEMVLSSPAVRVNRAGLQRALATAAERGELDLAKSLIASGADPSARLSGGYEEKDETYLMLAAASGVWAMLDDALARPHDIHAVDADGRTALVVMVWNAPQKEDIFPLIDRLLAAGAGHEDLDRVLLDTCQPNWIPGLVARGGNMNARDAKGNTPLFQSCSEAGVRAMLDAGADPMLRNREGKTAVEATYPPEDGKEDSRAIIIRQFVEARKAAGDRGRATAETITENTEERREHRGSWGLVAVFHSDDALFHQRDVEVKE